MRRFGKHSRLFESEILIEEIISFLYYKKT